MARNFREELKYNPKGNLSNTNDEATPTQLLAELDEYRKLVAADMQGYLKIMEALNILITNLEEKHIIGKTEIKARIKAAKSSVINSNNKGLDDIWGYNIITQNERDKEILMLIIYNILGNTREKIYNKSNGYNAYHCVGYMNSKMKIKTIEDLQEHMQKSEVYAYTESRGENKDAIKIKKYRYPILSAEILKTGKIDDSVKEAFFDSTVFLEQYFLNNSEIQKFRFPIEAQIKTREVQKSSICGPASHRKYKNVEPKRIKEKYTTGDLIRGIDFPYSFARNLRTGKMELEPSEQTLKNMWPFLAEIPNFDKMGAEHLINFDMHFAKIFPGLEKYIKENPKYNLNSNISDISLEEVWALLKESVVYDVNFIRTMQLLYAKTMPPRGKSEKEGETK